MYVLTYEPTSKRIENGLDEVYSVQMQKKVMKENSTILIVRVLCSIVLTLPHRLLQYYGKKISEKLTQLN